MRLKQCFFLMSFLFSLALSAAEPNPEKEILQEIGFYEADLTRQLGCCLYEVCLKFWAPDDYQSIIERQMELKVLRKAIMTRKRDAVAPFFLGVTSFADPRGSEFLLNCLGIIEKAEKAKSPNQPCPHCLELKKCITEICADKSMGLFCADCFTEDSTFVKCQMCGADTKEHLDVLESKGDKCMKCDNASRVLIKKRTSICSDCLKNKL